MITIENYLMGRDKQYKSDYTQEIREHAVSLLEKVNGIMQLFGESRSVNSGWRPKQLQMTINPKAPNSKHITGDAIDLEDKDGKFKHWCVDNELLLASSGLFMEDPRSTPTWVHLQQVSPKSGKVIFVP